MFRLTDTELNSVPRNIDLVEFNHGAINVTSLPPLTGTPAATIWGVGISTWLSFSSLNIPNFGPCMRTCTYSTTTVLRDLFRRDFRSGVKRLVVAGYSLLSVPPDLV